MLTNSLVSYQNKEDIKNMKSGIVLNLERAIHNQVFRICKAIIDITKKTTCENQVPQMQRKCRTVNGFLFCKM